MPQQSYTPVAGRLGAAAYSADERIASRSYPDEQAEATVTIGGTNTDGVYSFLLSELPDSQEDITIAFDRQAAEDNDAITAALLAVALADDDFMRIFSITSDGSLELTIVMRSTGIAFTIGGDTAPGSGTLVSAATVSAVVADLALGIAVVRTGTLKNIRVPALGDAARVIDGFTVLGNTGIATLPTDGTGSLAASVDRFVAPAEVSVVKDTAGRWFAPEDAVSPGDPVHVRVNATGAEVFGALRGSRDGVADVWTVTPNAVNDLTYSLQIAFPEFGEVYIFEVLGDASATATEICDDFRTAMALDLPFTARVVATGTATLILTGQDAGAAFVPADGGSLGNYTSIVNTTPAVMDTVEIPGAEWETEATAGNLAVARINLP